jgi:hypothetical protein
MKLEAAVKLKQLELALEREISGYRVQLHMVIPGSVRATLTEQLAAAEEKLEEWRELARMAEESVLEAALSRELDPPQPPDAPWEHMPAGLEPLELLELAQSGPPNLRPSRDEPTRTPLPPPGEATTTHHQPPE